MPGEETYRRQTIFAASKNLILLLRLDSSVQSIIGATEILRSMCIPGSALLLVRQTHDECQSDVESVDVIVVEMSDLPSDSFAPNRHRLIGHHL